MMGTTTPTNKVFISRTDTGFPAYLDFSALRTSAIDYLGPITSSYWTDYNLHDPGITTLETLLYAVMDLGYRVNFPIADLLAPAPGAKTEMDLFTPAQMLGGNPFTINDYRKKLMDLTEVRNAWLDVGSPTAGVAGAGGVAGVAVRGVYSVYLELEMDRSDLGTDALWQAYRDKVVREVKEVLQAHRNLCEDFAEPVVLDRKPVTVQADIELEDGASPEEVYRSLVQRLYGFFSPAPPYYTLGELVQMGIPLDQVFAGRPFERWPSHGFILDRDLPERPTGRTPIYLSVVYRQLLAVPGVKTVKGLALDKQNTEGQPVWTAMLTENVLPVFDLLGSQFRWFRGEQLLAVDLAGETRSLQLQVIHGGKVFYPAADLDVAVPTGQWPEGLDRYYSIQNDYPQVYGIGEGGLPGTATAERQAQALQLKGYLLLFDQLLADYLAQLGRIQTLFSIRGEGKTFFAGDVSSVPGLGPLLRFPSAASAASGDAASAASGEAASAASGEAASATAGTVLVYPVAAADWAAISGAGSIGCGDLEKLSPFSFAGAADRDVALAQLALLFRVETPAVGYWVVDGGKVVYVLTGIGNELVLVSRSAFPDIASASKEAATVVFIGGVTKNYQLSVVTADDGQVGYSFTLLQNAASYVNYVQALLESPEQYTRRRTAFLQHLMDRFAESFTDYALLEAGFLSPSVIADRQVGLMEQFLGDLPVLSGGRGQAFNYTRPSWDTENISGLEKRFMAYAGTDERLRHWLCCFEVGAAGQPEGFVYRLTDKNRPRAFHTVEWKTEDEAKAVRDALVAKGQKGYRYPEVCLGGDNVHFQKSGTGGDWHFLIKCRNDYFAQIGLPGDREWTMFESVAGYDSADGAQQAFREQYLTILAMAMAPGNFGDNGPIGFSPTGPGLVFVPGDLQEAMKEAGLNVVDELVKAAKGYPIRQSGRWIFQLTDQETGESDWESAGDFASAQEAHVAFDYFRLLLNVGGNYFIEYDDERCGFRLGLREVLVESAAPYPTADAAWKAIEEFIMVAQTGGGFSVGGFSAGGFSAGGFHVEERTDGTWGYFVAAADKPAEVLARSPQPYYYAEMAEKAMDRAKACINMEGLQLVEHLLLRPEKGVKTAIPVCAPGTPLPGLTAQPGADPYSFIITVFLPAWPERFRKKENRQVLERRLQQETPAHILLRMLWLTPMDMCRWETAYREWLRSLRPEPPCVDYSADEWMKMLFAESVQCLAADVSDGDEWLSEINLLFCWKDRACADTSGWKLDVPNTVVPAGIQFKGVPGSAGQSGDPRKVVGGTGTGSAGGTTTGSGTGVAGGAGTGPAAAGGSGSAAEGGSGLVGMVKKVESDLVKKAEDLVDKVKGATDKAENVVDKVQDATDKVHDVSNRLKEVENIAKDVIPLVIEEIPVVGPVITAAEKIAVRAGLWARMLRKGADILETLLKRLKGLLGKQEEK